MVGGNSVDRIVIWSAFMDSELPRRLGRRLPRRLCVKSPKPEEIMEAARRLGLQSEIETKAYPRRWHAERKAVLLDANTSRSEAIRRIAEEIRIRRSQ
jgi:signal recognition particle subunit SRP19